MIRAGTSMLLGFDLTPLTRLAGALFGRQLALLVGINKHLFTNTHAALLEMIAQADSTKCDCSDADIVRDEVVWCAQLCAWACELWVARLSIGIHKGIEWIDEPTRKRLASQLNPLALQLGVLWIRRSKEPGLSEAREQFDDVLLRLTHGPQFEHIRKTKVD
eukprot:c5148_g1_i1.p2 GENE.c5148_g1_i1~~c5148_g1_i1.p2  ORF type:complete len:162 (+),score=39.08 c5148_g1_i1:702-1187(+)